MRSYALFLETANQCRRPVRFFSMVLGKNIAGARFILGDSRKKHRWSFEKSSRLFGFLLTFLALYYKLLIFAHRKCEKEI